MRICGSCKHSANLVQGHSGNIWVGDCLKTHKRLVIRNDSEERNTCDLYVRCKIKVDWKCLKPLSRHQLQPPEAQTEEAKPAKKRGTGRRKSAAPSSGTSDPSPSCAGSSK